MLNTYNAPSQSASGTFTGSYGPAFYSDFSGAPLYLMNAHYKHFANIAVCGATGTGKSSLVNALLNLAPGDPDAAPVGLSAQTNMPVAYPFNDELLAGGPGGPQTARRTWKPILVWDLPGAGCRRFPQDSYCKDMGLGFYDLVILVCARRISEVDKSLVTELQNLHVPFFVVRSKLDIDVKNDELDHARKESETLAIVQKSLREHGFRSSFMLSTRRPAKFQLHELCLNLYAWIRVHVRRQDVSEVQCPICTETIPSLCEGDGHDEFFTKIVQWKVGLDRHDGQYLGVDVDSDTLEIIAVLEEGLIPQWNEEHVDLAVQAGDRIRLVNDLWEPESLIEEAKECKFLEITFLREVLLRKDQAHEFGPDDGPSAAATLLLGRDLRHRKCYECGLVICGRCAAMLALSGDPSSSDFDALCPGCNRLMSGASGITGYFFWLWWWFF